MEIKRSERGWPGHFNGCRDCIFRRNTLLEFEDIKIVVSTVGNYIPRHEETVEKTGLNNYYETMAFHSDYKDIIYHDADIQKQIYFSSNCGINYYDTPTVDNDANEMHETVVVEIIERLQNGDRFEEGNNGD